MHAFYARISPIELKYITFEQCTCITFHFFRHLCLSITADNRINLLQEQLNALTKNLDETIIIRPTARPCNSLGAPSNPALSCEQLKEACQAPSGDYFIQGGHATFYKVHSVVWHHFILKGLKELVLF